ncbi:unnamed protein product [Meloidogyne enterolobii]|uniref:Uncharacterized protein n=1 Tax=Meloidogyne enterolobii TaxID=390850 RepID=A0ACB1A8C3_MELEN
MFYRFHLSRFMLFRLIILTFSFIYITEYPFLPNLHSIYFSTLLNTTFIEVVSRKICFRDGSSYPKPRLRTSPILNLYQWRKAINFLFIF